mgnify:CR=1 FL=1
MSTWNLGSVATQLHSLIEGIPTAISGAILLDIVDRARLYMESYTGQAIGSVGIAERFQPALIDLSAANLLATMELIGADVSSVSLGEFSESKGTQSNLSVARQFFEQRATEELNSLGRQLRWSKANG